MKLRQITALLFASLAIAHSQDFQNNQPATIPLSVPAGVPLRLYLTKRVPKRMGAPVEAMFAEPVYAYDREVIPSGTRAMGHVSRLEPVPRWQRTQAILGGDFTPLHIAEIQFTSLVLPGGREMDIQTVASTGLNTLFPLHPSKHQQNATAPSGVIGTAKQQVKDRAYAEIDRVRSIPNLVRDPGKKELVEDYLMSRLPYHPQYLRSRTRIDAELAAPLNFGSETLPAGSLALLGSEPAPGSIVHARLLTSLDSADAKPGDKMNAVLEQPLFSPDHKLILPEGTDVEGSVVMAKKAGWFHHSGQLRFNFQSLVLPDVAQFTKPSETVTPQAAFARENNSLKIRVPATLTAAEGGKEPLKVDSEGDVRAAQSKTRFIGTALAFFVSRASGDLDPVRGPSVGGVRGPVIGQSPNIAGRTLGGGMGFGLLGMAAAQSSRVVGAAFGYYGLAWSVFSTVIAHGPQVQFNKDASIDIGLNTRQDPPKATAAKR